MSRVSLPVLLPVLLASLLSAPARADTPADEAIRLLNAQRAASGIPAGIAENTDWSQACAKHNDYQAANGGGLTHVEEPGRPGYTTEGAWAGGNSVLARGLTWTQGNPWETAPIHLLQLLSPRLTQMGVDDRTNQFNFVCATTWPGYASSGPAAHVVYTYPGDGQTGWRRSEVAREGPFTPGDKLGLPQPTETGPYLYALLDGPGSWFDLRPSPLTAASLTGPGGGVEVRTLDSTHPEVGPYMPPGAFVIPVSPLAPGTRYTASVTFSVGGLPVSRTWSFTTAATVPPPPPGPGPATGTSPVPGTGTDPPTGTGTDPTPISQPPPKPLGLSSTSPTSVRGRKVRVRVRCTLACRATASLRVKGESLVSRTVTLPARRMKTIELTLPRRFAGRVRRATVLVKAKDLAEGSSFASQSSKVNFSR